MSFMKLDIQTSPQIWEVLSHYIFNMNILSLILLHSLINSQIISFNSQIISLDGIPFIILAILHSFSLFFYLLLNNFRGLIF